MNRQVYFGSRSNMAWVPAPKINMARGLVTWENSTQRINGTANVAAGQSPHREYDVEWNILPDRDMSFVDAALRGDYGVWFADLGTKPTTDVTRRGLYFLDPFAMSTNILPDWIASPGRAIRGGRPMMRKTAMIAKNNPNPSVLDRPSQGVEYALTADTVPMLHPIPIPPGYTLHLGVAGGTWGPARMRILNDDDPTLNELTPITTSSTSLTNYTYANVSGTTAWRTLTFSGTGNLTFYGAVAVIVPNGTPAPTGSWRPGQGSGVLVPSGVSRTGVSAAIGYETLLAKLTEVDI